MDATVLAVALVLALTSVGLAARALSLVRGVRLDLRDLPPPTWTPSTEEVVAFVNAVGRLEEIARAGGGGLTPEAELGARVDGLVALHLGNVDDLSSPEVRRYRYFAETVRARLLLDLNRTLVRMGGGSPIEPDQLDPYDRKAFEKAGIRIR